jgi:magnesium chelatase subunit I
MKIENINTLGELKESGYKSNSIKEELRSNLRAKIKQENQLLKEFMV